MIWKDAYLEEQILNADPLELVTILYRAAIDAVEEAARSLAAGHIAERSNAITRAQTILAELDASLDHTHGEQISAKLAALYAYMRGRLTEANLRQESAPLTEVADLLKTLYGAWEKASLPASATAASGPSAPPAPFQTWADVPGNMSHMWCA